MLTQFSDVTYRTYVHCKLDVADAPSLEILHGTTDTTMEDLFSTSTMSDLENMDRTAQTLQRTLPVIEARKTVVAEIEAPRHKRRKSRAMFVILSDADSSGSSWASLHLRAIRETTRLEMAWRRIKFY